jgi:hypothetical protein
LWNSASIFPIAFRAALLVCDGSLSMRNRRRSFFYVRTLQIKHYNASQWTLQINCHSFSHRELWEPHL